MATKSATSLVLDDSIQKINIPVASDAILLSSCRASEVVRSISPSSSTAKSGSTIELTLNAKDSPPCSSNVSSAPVFSATESSHTVSASPGSLRTSASVPSTASCSLATSTSINIPLQNSMAVKSPPPATQTISTTASASVPCLPRSCVNPVSGTPISSGGLSPSNTVASNVSRLSSSGALNLTLTQSTSSVPSNLPASVCAISSGSTNNNRPINMIVTSSSTAVKLAITSSASATNKSMPGRIVQSFCTLSSPVESSSSQPSMSHVHIPRGAAVVANMAAGSRSSQAVTASAVHRAGALSNRGIQLGQSSWNKGAPASKLAAGTTVFTTIASSTAPKLTRFPATPPLASRPVGGNLLTVAAGTSTSSAAPSTALRITSTTASVRSTPSTTGVLRTNSISRVANVNTVEVMRSVQGSSASAVTAAPRLTVATTVKPLDGTVLTNFPNVCRPTIVATPSAVSRTVLTQTRTPLGVSVRPHSNPGLRLTQATIGRPAAVTSLALTCVRSAAPQTSTSTIATAKVRGIPSSRFSLTPGNQLIPGCDSSSTSSVRVPTLGSSSATGSGSSQCYTTSTSIAIAPPARPLSSPAICVPGRPVMNASRPSSTGPSTSPAPVQSPASARPGVTATRGAAVSGEGVLTMRSCSAAAAAAAETRVSRPTQQFMHLSPSNGQKVVNSGGVGNVSVIGGSTIRCGPLNNSGTAPGSSIAVGSSSSAASNSSLGSVSVVTARQGGRLSDHHSGPLGSASGKAFGVVSGGSSSSSSAAAAAAVLPPGTTITPTVLSPTSLSKHESSAPAAVLIQRPIAGPGNSSTGLASQIHDGKPSVTSVSVRPNSGVISSSGGRRPAVGALNSESSSTALAPSQQSQQSAAASSKPAASPRPTILRKRSEFDVGSSAKACRNLTGALSSSSGSPSGSSSSPPSPKRPDSGGNSGASTGSVTLSADSSPGLLIEETEGAEEARIPSVSTPAVLPSLMEGISPRKKPRKQKLTGNELQDAPHSSDEEDSRAYKRLKREVEGEDAVDGCTSWSEQASHSRLPPLSSCSRFHGLGLASGGSLKNGVSAHRPSMGPSNRIAFNHRHSSDASTAPGAQSPKGIKKARKNLGSSSGCTSEANAENNYSKDACSDSIDKNSSLSSPESPYRNKRKHMSLLNSYSRTHLPRINHFVRYSDVEVKKEKKTTVNNLAGQKMAMQKLEGWKVIHVGGQVSDLVDVEQEVSTRLNDILDSLENKISGPHKVLSKDVDQICELIKANVQRSKIIEDQMREAKVQMSNLFVHKEKVASILKNYTGKRQLRKKDRR